jgi:adenosylhomocysteine nucleosidase
MAATNPPTTQHGTVTLADFEAGGTGPPLGSPPTGGLAAQSRHRAAPIVNHSLITFAIEEEARPFRRLKRIPFSQVLITGMGPRNAEQALRQSLTGPLPARVLTCGFAGGLNPDFPLGTVMFSADEDFDLTPALVTAGARPARFHHADRVLVTAAEKRALRQMTGADAVDMESGVIRAICKERGLPSATVRVISDAADDDLPLDFNLLMDADARLRYDRLVVELLKSPRRIRELIKMAFRTRRASGELTSVLTSLFAS